MRKPTVALAIALFLVLCFAATPIARAEGPTIHIVRPSETLWSLSMRYSITLEALRCANGLANPNWVISGQTLLIPKAVPSIEYHLVRPGETLWSISNKYDVSTSAIAFKNDIHSNMIYIGQTLTIPHDCASGSEEAKLAAGGGDSKPAPRVNVDRSSPNPVVAQRKVVTTNPYPSGSLGFDISFPQCNRALPSAPHTFIIVGVNAGRALRFNECFAALYDWAKRTSTAAPSIYMNLNYVAGVTAFHGASGPAGQCGDQEERCKAYNYGYNAAKETFEYAGERTAKMWWIDIELDNTWSDSDALNGQVVQGAIDFFQNRGVLVGIYSSAKHWSKILGSFSPKHVNQAVLPLWIFLADDRAEAPSFCSAAKAFGGGTPWLVQYPSNGFDGVYVC